MHIVWCPKCRRRVLVGAVADRLRELLAAKATEQGWTLEALEVMPDHVPVFVGSGPGISAARLAHRFKGCTSRMLRQEFARMRSRLPTLWSKSYFVASVGRYFGSDDPPVHRRTGDVASATAEAMRRAMQSAQLKQIRAELPEEARWSFSSQQATLRRLNNAMTAFFRQAKGRGPAGYHRFKSAERFDSVEWPKDGDGCRWKPDARRVYLQGIGDMKVDMHRVVEGRVKTIRIKREGRRWYVVLSCDDVPARPLPPTGAAVGIDVGLTAFLATSDGAFVDNPRHGRRAAGRLAKAQRVLARKRRGSNNRRAARAVVANRHRKIANQRRDFHHRVARGLVADHDVICLEDLAVANMARSASGTVEEPGTNVAQKAGLNRSIHDAGWAQFPSILTGKAEEAGRRLVVVNPRYTSQMCFPCGHGDAANRVGAVFRCLKCGHTAHADTNSACDILRAGLALLAPPESGAA